MHPGRKRTLQLHDNHAAKQELTKKITAAKTWIDTRKETYANTLQVRELFYHIHLFIFTYLGVSGCQARG